MSEQVLTPSEWGDRTFKHWDIKVVEHPGALSVLTGHRQHFDEAGRHKLAAMALHGQEFGFTWEDVDALLVVAKIADDLTGGQYSRVLSVADRIAALLPPRTDD